MKLTETVVCSLVAVFSANVVPVKSKLTKKQPKYFGAKQPSSVKAACQSSKDYVAGC